MYLPIVCHFALSHFIFRYPLGCVLSYSWIFTSKEQLEIAQLFCWNLSYLGGSCVQDLLFSSPKGLKIIPMSSFSSDKAFTIAAFGNIIAQCKDVFLRKMQDYGTAWRILRLPSLTDQMFIKAQRIRTLQQTSRQAVADDPRLDFVGIINYALMALIQLRLGVAANKKEAQMPSQKALAAYDREVADIMQLLANKNHDYGEAWRQMRVTSITDLLLMKLLRLKQIEDNQGQVKNSEPINSIYQDMVNYAVFSLILLKSAET